MLPANRRAGPREAGPREKGASHLLTLAVDPQEQQHDAFLERQDRVQSLYERARRAVLGGRARVPDNVLGSLQAHGVAGLFIEPERALVSCLPSSLQSGSRTGTALHHAHLPEELFETVTRALTEGVGVRAAARILKVDKKTVLRVLARAADHAVKVSRALLKGIVVTECQLDEMWSFIGKKEGHLEPLESLAGILGDAGIWIAFDAVHKVAAAPPYAPGRRRDCGRPAPWRQGPRFQ